jgi:hypothetical protein
MPQTIGKIPLFLGQAEEALDAIADRYVEDARAKTNKG